MRGWVHRCRSRHKLQAGVHHTLPADQQNASDGPSRDWDGDSGGSGAHGSHGSTSSPSNGFSSHSAPGGSHDGAGTGRRGPNWGSFQAYSASHEEHKCPSYQTLSHHPSDLGQFVKPIEHTDTCGLPKSLIRTKQLGSGGFGKVYEVWESATKRHLAMKTMRRSRVQSNTVSIEARFIQEVEIMRSLQHPHIVQFLDSYSSPDHFSILMQPVANTDLSQLLFQPDVAMPTLGWSAKLLETNLLESMGCLASAVHYLHSGGEQKNSAVYHHDIKPANILVMGSGSFILADFGIPKLVRDPIGVDSSECCPKSLAAMTPKYAAPETRPDSQLYQSPTTSRSSDVWSLGCVFLEIPTWTLSGTSGLRDFKMFRAGGQEDSSFAMTLDKTQQWLEKLKRQQLERQGTLPYHIPFNFMRKMLNPVAEDRPTAHKVWLRFPKRDCCSKLDGGNNISLESQDKDSPRWIIPLSEERVAATTMLDEQSTKPLVAYLSIQAVQATGQACQPIKYWKDVLQEVKDLAKAPMPPNKPWKSVYSPVGRSSPRPSDRPTLCSAPLDRSCDESSLEHPD